MLERKPRKEIKLSYWIFNESKETSKGKGSIEIRKFVVNEANENFPIKRVKWRKKKENCNDCFTKTSECSIKKWNIVKKKSGSRKKSKRGKKMNGNETCRRLNSKTRENHSVWINYFFGCKSCDQWNFLKEAIWSTWESCPCRRWKKIWGNSVRWIQIGFLLHDER